MPSISPGSSQPCSGGRADLRLLDSYESERLAFARRLVPTLALAFVFINGDGAMARFVGVQLVRHLLLAIFRLRAMRGLMFQTISQTNVNYRDRAISFGKAGRVAAGDRLSWMRFGPTPRPGDVPVGPSARR